MKGSFKSIPVKHAFFLLFLLPTAASAQIPSGYYNGTQGLTGTALQTALHNKIDNHTDVGYTPGLWNAYYTTDRKPNSGNPGRLWTIYSDKPDSIASPYEFTLGDQCGSSNANVEGGCYNREHIWPRTYFGGQVSPMNSDLWIVYPTDYWVNSKRQSFPYGKVTAPTFRSRNGSKVGPQTFPGAPSGSAFEPIDSFKGDIARSYFYVATRYLSEDASWSDWEMANKAVLKPWAVQMLLQWHQMDPVSQKEKLRNDAVYLEQGNRNPFIDSPRFAECIYTPNCSGLSVDERAVAAFSVSPNPATNRIQVVLRAGAVKEGMLELLDVRGRLWLWQEVGEDAEWLDTVGLPRGVYVLRLRSAKGVVVERVVLQ